jgi:hypothetical protein
MKVFGRCTIGFMIALTISVSLPGCQKDEPETISNPVVPPEKVDQVAKVDAFAEPDAKETEPVKTVPVETETEKILFSEPTTTAFSPEQNVENALVSLLPVKLQNLLLLGIEPEQHKKKLQGFKIQKALLTRKPAPVLEDAWKLLSKERDKICTEYITLDGADCGCDSYLDRLVCNDRTHILPPTFTHCEVIKQENELPDLAICISADRSHFRIAYVWQELLVVKDWPSRMLERMEDLNTKNHNLCMQQNERKKCETKCDIRSMTYEKCEAECKEGWDRMHDGVPYDQANEDHSDDEDEIDEKEIELCQRDCRRENPSDSAYYVDEVQITDHQVPEPGVFVLNVERIEGLVDEENQEAEKPVFPPKQFRKIVLHDSLLKGGTQKLTGLANKKGVWISDLDEFSNTITKNQPQEYYDAPGYLAGIDQLKKTISGNDKHLQTQLIDILLTKQINIKELVKPLSESLRGKLHDYIDKTLSKTASYKLLGDLFEDRYPARQTTLEKVLTGIEIRLGKIPPDLVREYLYEASDEDWVIDDNPVDEHFRCPYLEEKSLKCKVGSEPRVLVCQAEGEIENDQEAGGEAWVVGLDQQGLPILVEWLKSEKFDELVPKSQIDQWTSQRLSK